MVAGEHFESEGLIQYNKDWNSSTRLGIDVLHQVWRPNPIQQGLKRLGGRLRWRWRWLSEGLIQYNKDWNDLAGACAGAGAGVWRPNPIQQGLKRSVSRLRRRAFSAVWRPNPIQQGLKHQRDIDQGEKSSWSEGLIQYNKDWNITGRISSPHFSESLKA